MAILRPKIMKATFAKAEKNIVLLVTGLYFCKTLKYHFRFLAYKITIDFAES